MRKHPAADKVEARRAGSNVVTISKAAAQVPAKEAAIEATREFLEPHVKSATWSADPPEGLRALRAAQDELFAKGLSQRTLRLASYGLALQLSKRRPGKPTRLYRDSHLYLAARALIEQGYKRSRNEATVEKGSRESASSIIRKALALLDVRMTEKQIDAIVQKYYRE
jgi:hypothetical protein